MAAVANTQGKSPSMLSIEKSILSRVVLGEAVAVGMDEPTHPKLPLRRDIPGPMQHNFLPKPIIPHTVLLSPLLDNLTSKLAIVPSEEVEIPESNHFF
ncbi:hypothetical protein ACH5RR_012723 [Cinchona calisaya]|uniref:Uncharacterized protein n=1 Tax=Cinchona calisaya TaxID=153742 RepID=A0ABD3AB66_9GENT